jgi:drug/metabolite transporter (DMT)-like permease
MWEALALTAALCQVLRNTVMKRLGHELDEYMAVWGHFTFLLPFAALFVLWHGAPVIKPGFVWACLLFAVCQIISTMALSKALKLSPISMVTALWKVSLLVTSRKYFAAVPRHWLAFVSFGLFAALTTVSQGHAYLMTPSSYVEAVKQVEILFALAVGVVVFGERQKVSEIAPGAAVMLTGVVLLSLAA